MKNFECKNCVETKQISNYSIAIVNGNSVYREKSTGNIIQCDKCGLPMSSMSKFDGNAPYFARVGSMTPQDKKEVLKKRSSDHYNKEIKERAHEMHKEMKRGILGKDI